MTGKIVSNHANGPAGTILRASGPHGPQLVETAGRSWSDEAEALFLDSLAATCHVGRSARAAGFSTVTVYSRRRRDAGFADRWQAALAQGYIRVETALIRRTADQFEGVPDDPDTPIPAVSAAEAIALLRFHRAGATDQHGKVYGRQLRRRSIEEVRASILAKLEAIVAMREEDAAATLAAIEDRGRES